VNCGWGGESASSTRLWRRILIDETSINTKLTKTHWLGAEERALQGSLQTASTTKFFKDLVERP
jgi:hypothetical protein